MATSCPKLSMLQAHVEGFATPDERAAVVVHLECCMSCRQLVLAVAGETPTPAPSDAGDGDSNGAA
jgi:hypothetical protein